jgi:hypothetical protein
MSWLGEWRGQNDASNCATTACYLTAAAAVACVYQLGAAHEDWQEGRYMGATFRVVGFVLGSGGAIAAMATKAYMPIVNAVASEEADSGASNTTSQAVGHLTAVSTTVAATLIAGNATGYVASKIGDGIQKGLCCCVSTLFNANSNRRTVMLDAPKVIIHPGDSEQPYTAFSNV